MVLVQLPTVLPRVNQSKVRRDHDEWHDVQVPGPPSNSKTIILNFLSFPNIISMRERIKSNFRALSSADFLVFLINMWLWLSIPSHCNSNIEVLAFRKNQGN